MNRAQRQRLAAMIGSEVKFDCSLKSYTSFHIGGPAAALVILDRKKDLRSLLNFVKEENLSWRVIGRGTNTLVRDEGFAGVVILLGKGFKKIRRDDTLGNEKTLLRVGAGYGLSRLSTRCAEEGLSGLEFSCGIPGTVGGAIIMNAGAWGKEISQVIGSVTVETGEGCCNLDPATEDFSYRIWRGFRRFQGIGVVTETTLQLSGAEPHEIKEQCRKLLEKRKQKQPTRYPNAGSIFKNPPRESAGRLIEISGLKGTVVGGAMVSEKHGNFIVNTGRATANDVLELIATIQEKVKKEHNVDLEPEVHII